MNIQKKAIGASIATAAAALFIAGAAVSMAPTASQAADGVMCAGINSCKGLGECQGVGHSCTGMNACKGQGWITKSSASECTAAGGTVLKKKQ